MIYSKLRLLAKNLAQNGTFILVKKSYQFGKLRIFLWHATGFSFENLLFCFLDF